MLACGDRTNGVQRAPSIRLPDGRGHSITSSRPASAAAAQGQSLAPALAARERHLCADVLRTALAEHELIVGETVLAELGRVLREKIGTPEAQARDVVGFVRQHADVAAEVPVPAVDVRDANDLAILAGAIQGGADVLVTGDKDLLVLGRVGSLPIRDPRGFWDLIKER
jgi:predicted nucleic acid-binding protein